MTDEGREGVKNIWMTGLGQFLRFVLLLATAITLPRLFGVEVYGMFSAILAAVSVLFVFSILGLRFVELRFLAPLLRTGNRAEAAVLASSVFNLRILAGLIAALVCAFWVGLSNTNQDLTLLVGVGLFALARYWLEAARSLLLPLGRLPWYIGIELANLFLSLCALILGYLTGGLADAFFAASAAGILLTCLGFRLNREVLEIVLGQIDWARVRSILPYCFYSLLSALFIALQASTPVWILSLVGDLKQVAYLGVSVQILISLNGLCTAAWQSLLPILSSIQEKGEHQRLVQWSSLLMRVAAALFSIATVIWVAVGEDVTRVLLGVEYQQAYPCVTMILLAAIGFSMGVCSNGVIMLRKRASLGSLNYLVSFLSTLTGVLWLYGLGLAGDAHHMSQVYAISSLTFFLFSYVALGFFEKIWIPVGRTIVLLLPALAAPQAMWWDADLAFRIISSLALVTLYSGGVVAFCLVPWPELRYALSLFRR